MMSRSDSPLPQLTVRGFSPRLADVIRRRAEAQGLSLNKAVLRMLEEAAGLRRPAGGSGSIGDALDEHAGTWTAAEARRLKRAVADFEQVDPDLWS